jgi:hypothetical protein
LSNNKGTNKENRDPEKENNPYSTYARYWGMAVQMMLIIAAGSFGGYKLDKILNTSVPVITLVLSLGSVTLAIWLFIREFNNNKKTK